MGNLLTSNEAEHVAIAVLGYLATDRVRLDRFLAMTGIEHQDLRAAAREPSFLAGVLAHVAGDEKTLEEFALATDHSPEAPLEALRSLGGRDHWNDG